MPLAISATGKARCTQNETTGQFSRACRETVAQASALWALFAFRMLVACNHATRVIMPNVPLWTPLSVDILRGAVAKPKAAVGDGCPLSSGLTVFVRLHLDRKPRGQLSPRWKAVCLLPSLLNSLERIGTFVEESFRDVAAERRASGSWLLGR
jgi:hypothetical protein